MARAHKVNSSRKPHTCGRGGHAIPTPEGYYWAAPGYHAPKQYRCLSHPFRESELTASLVSMVYAAREALEDEVNNATTHEELEQGWETFKGELESYRDQRQEALDAWEYGNSTLEEFVNDAEEALSEAEGFQVEEYSGELTGDAADGEDEEYEAWLDEQREAVMEAAQGLNL